MRFLVIGAGGMVGHAVGLWLSEHGHKVVGFARAESGLFPCVKGDARDEALLDGTILRGEFDAVINCAALLVNASEKRRSEALWVNSYLPNKLAEICRRNDAHLVHISTDGVFSGKFGPYADDAVCDDRSFYGRTKALGEVSGSGALTIRTCPVGPDYREAGSGLLDWFVSRASEELPVVGWSRAMWTGVTSIELAQIVEKASVERVSGIVHVVPGGGISKRELLVLFSKHLAGNAISVGDDPSVEIDRRLVPSATTLCSDVMSYDDQMAILKEWICDHLDIYPDRYKNVVSCG